MANLIEEYMARTPGSKRLFEHALSISPGGVQGNPRFFAPYPVYMSRGVGSKIYDVDKNEYIDYFLGTGPLILGHSHPAVVEAIGRQMKSGMQFGAASEHDIKLSEKIKKHVPCAEMVRLTTSGSEATLFAVRLARAYTKKQKIVKFEGAYHGSNDLMLVSFAPPLDRAGPASKPNSVADSAGILPSIVENTIVLPYNDVGALEATLEERNDIAAVVVDAFSRGLPMKKEFMPKLRSLTQKHGVLMILDEVITGFRLALGGAQEYCGVKPDIATLGKIIGGGFSIGAFVGKKEIMQITNPQKKGENYVYHASTFAGHALTSVAGVAAIEELEKTGTYKKLHDSGEEIRKALKDAAEDSKIPVQVHGPDPMTIPFFTDKEVWEYRAAAAQDKNRLSSFRTNLILRGIFPGFDGRFFMATVHDGMDLKKTVEACYESMKKLKGA